MNKYRYSGNMDEYIDKEERAYESFCEKEIPKKCRELLNLLEECPESVFEEYDLNALYEELLGTIQFIG